MRVMVWGLSVVVFVMGVGGGCVRGQEVPGRVGAEYTQAEVYKESLAFNRKGLVEAYKAGGKRDARWDSAAEAALDKFAVFAAQGQVEETAYPVLIADAMVTHEEIAEAAQKAIDAGCVDPMVYYAKGMALVDMGRAAEARPWFEKAAAALPGSPYGAYRQFKVMNRVWLFVGDAKQREGTWPEVERLATEMAKGPFMNDAERKEVGLMFYQTLVARKHEQYEGDLERIGKVEGVDTWILKSAEVELEIDLAWDARGDGWAQNVTPAGWAGFREHLDKARAAADAAFAVHPELPEPATSMIRVAMGTGDRGEVNKWFVRALTAEPDFARAYSSMFMACMPRWGGSNEEIMTIGRTSMESGAYETAVPWMYVWAVIAVAGDNVDGDASIFKKPEVQKAVMEVVGNYSEKYKGNARLSGFFNSYLAALKVKAGDYAGARQAFDGITGEVDAGAFNYFKQYLSRSMEQTYLQTYKDQAAVAAMRAAYGRHDYQAAIGIVDQIFAKDHPVGREAEIFNRHKEAFKLMTEYQAGKALDFTDARTMPFWIADYPARYEGGALVNGGWDQRVQYVSRFYQADRHYEIHLKFEYTDMPAAKDRWVEFEWGTGTGGNKWGIELVTDPARLSLRAPGQDRRIDLPLKVVAKNSVDIVYWAGTPEVKLNGERLDYSFATPASVRGMSKLNTMALNTNAPVRITEFTLRHLDAQPK